MNRATLSRPHILIIDDVPDNVEILGTVLATDYEVRFATSGPEGLELARRFPTDLILLDVMMPEMDGYETLRRLQQDAALAKIPVIFVTAMGETEAEAKGLALGAADYIAKPININTARLRIRGQIEREMLKRKLESALDASGQLQNSLREKMQELDLILDNSSVGITFVKDRRQVWANRRMGELFGYTPEEMKGQSTALFYAAPSAYEALGQEAYPVLARGERYTAEQEMQRKDGRRIWLRLSGQAIPASHSLGGSIWVFDDITERKQIEAELEQHRHHLEELVQQRTAALMETEARACHILNSSADGLYGSDSEGIITFINPAGCALLGYREEQLVGRVAHAVFHHSQADGTPYPAEDCPSRKALKLGQKVRVDHEVFWRADGRAVPVMYASYPMLQNGAIIGEVTSFVDVSVQRAAAQARERALMAAEKLARVRSEFLANISHELRTPLNGVLGFADIGARNAQNPEKARDAFAKIKTSGNRLLDVITNLLDFSNIDAGRLRLEATEVSLSAVVDQAIKVIRDRATAKRLALRVELAPDLPQCCSSDPLRLGQLLSHLLSNAVKFTEAGSVTLSLARQGEQLLFTVADSGIGMSSEQLGHLFNPFQQADASSTRKFGGIGLGLAISKRLVELMGGDLRVDSQPGVGSRVELRLPYVPCAAACPSPSAPADRAETPAKPLTGISILVAEDEIFNRMVLEDTLIEDGARVVLVNNGQEALERVLRDGREAYDIVLMDIQMPVMDGYEATRRIVALAPDLPIIAQTSHAFSEEMEKCFAAGMCGHIAKPLDPAELVSIVLEHVAARQK